MIATGQRILDELAECTAPTPMWELSERMDLPMERIAGELHILVRDGAVTQTRTASGPQSIRRFLYAINPKYKKP